MLIVGSNQPLKEKRGLVQGLHRHFLRASLTLRIIILSQRENEDLFIICHIDDQITTKHVFVPKGT